MAYMKMLSLAILVSPKGASPTPRRFAPPHYERSLLDNQDQQKPTDRLDKRKSAKANWPSPPRFPGM